MAHTDLPYLRHMLDAVEKVQKYLDGVDRDQFEENEEKQDAVIRQLEILGEAASQVDAEFRRAAPHIPWSNVIGMRSRLIHGYLSVDLDIVWRTATHHVPLLHADLVTTIRGLE